MAINRSMATFLLSIVCIYGCATPAKIWKSSPPSQVFENACLQARIEPIKEGQPYFTGFRLSVENRSDKELTIDWNRSRYLRNGKAFGGFVFAGIDPKTIKEKSIPADILPAGQTFEKKIAPAKLIALSPLRHRSVQPGQSRIMAGMVPAGENGILLVVECEGRESKHSITLSIAEEDEY